MGDISDNIVNGLSCSHCGIHFQQEHGYPVLCRECFDTETDEERAGLQKAIIPELGDDDEPDWEEETDEDPFW